MFSLPIVYSAAHIQLYYMFVILCILVLNVVSFFFAETTACGTRTLENNLLIYVKIKYIYLILMNVIKLIMNEQNDKQQQQLSLVFEEDFYFS